MPALAGYPAPQPNFVPFFRYWVVSATRSPNTDSAIFFGRSWPSANSAAICLSVMVTWGATVAGAATFLAGAQLLRRCAFFGGAAFFAGAATLAAGAAAFLAAGRLSSLAA